TLSETRQHPKHDFGRELIPALVNRGQVSVYNFAKFGTKLSTYWQDVGTLDGYYNSNMELLSNSASGLREVAKWPFYLPHARPAKVSSSASVHGSVITDDATIEGDATVSHSVLSLQVTVGEQATIEDSILMPGVRVGKGARIRRA